MGDVLYGIDFKNKKRQEPIPTPLDEGLAIIAIALGQPLSIDDIPGLEWMYKRPTWRPRKIQHERHQSSG